MNKKKVIIPPTVAEPASFFYKVHINTMHLPASNRYSYFIQVCDSLSGWVEGRVLRKENGRTVEVFIFKEILCRWGIICEIITNNGPPLVEALDHLADKYNIRHIQISAYNSRANGAVETTHTAVRDALVKVSMRGGGIKRWLEHIHYVLWAD
jgi:hypothetical protein